MRPPNWRRRTWAAPGCLRHWPLQDPEVLEKVAALAKNEGFQEKVQQLAQNEQFTAAAGEYANDMKDDVITDAKLAEELGLDSALETGADAIEEEEEEEEEP
eukprot:3343023-Prymnesium_polylepis.1